MIQKIYNYAKIDGLFHCVVSAAIVVLLKLYLPALIAAGIVLAIGIAKELVWDKALGRGTAEWKDLVCDLVGILLGAL